MEKAEKDLIRKRAILERDLRKALIHLELLKLSQVDLELQILTLKSAIEVVREELRKK